MFCLGLICSGRRGRATMACSKQRPAPRTRTGKKVPAKCLTLPKNKTFLESVPGLPRHMALFLPSFTQTHTKKKAGKGKSAAAVHPQRRAGPSRASALEGAKLQPAPARGRGSSALPRITTCSRSSPKRCNPPFLHLLLPRHFHRPQSAAASQSPAPLVPHGPRARGQVDLRSWSPRSLPKC